MIEVDRKTTAVSHHLNHSTECIFPVFIFGSIRNLRKINCLNDLLRDCFQPKAVAHLSLVLQLPSSFLPNLSRPLPSPALLSLHSSPLSISFALLCSSFLYS